MWVQVPPPAQVKKRVIIAHGWASNPNDCWFPWIKKEFEKNDFEVFVPAFPNPGIPEIKSWVKTLDETVGVIDGATYFVGHSIGCQTILRYLQTLSLDQKIAGVVFVGGWFSLIGLETVEEKIVTDPWLNMPIDFEKIKFLISKSVAIFSDNDQWVALDNQNTFRDKLGSEIVIEHNKGHFDRTNKVFELPSALEAIIKMAK
ncbi:MAG: serine hydrolase family protein [Candidatus Vogelbacteria bacterium]|nr:serine hydrolase family protein [Candidatus Vogelbacteria bacterium]